MYISVFEIIGHHYNVICYKLLDKLGVPFQLLAQRILCLQSFNDFYVVIWVYPTQNNTFRKTCDTKIKWVYATT